MKWFIYLCNVRRRLIPNVSRIALPRDYKRRKDQQFKFELSEKYLEAMKILQEEYISPPVLALPQAKEQMTLVSNACNVQAGCVLLQEKLDNTTNPIE